MSATGGDAKNPSSRREEAAPAPAAGAAADLPKARAPQPDDLVVSPEAACDLVSEHGGEIVIMDDGRVVFMNAAAHLVELAAALDPDNPDIRKRLQAIERAKAAGGGGTAAGAGGTAWTDPPQTSTSSPGA